MIDQTDAAFRELERWFVHEPPEDTPRQECDRMEECWLWLVTIYGLFVLGAVLFSLLLGGRVF